MLNYQRQIEKKNTYIITSLIIVGFHCVEEPEGVTLSIDILNKNSYWIQWDYKSTWLCRVHHIEGDTVIPFNYVPRLTAVENPNKTRG